MLAANVGAQLTAFVTNPATALVLANMKEATGSGKPLLQPDPTQPTRRMIFGVPLLTSPEAAVGTVWGLPAERVVTAVRRDAEVKADRSVFFTSDRVAVRATCRVGFGQHRSTGSEGSRHPRAGPAGSVSGVAELLWDALAGQRRTHAPVWASPSAVASPVQRRTRLPSRPSVTRSPQSIDKPAETELVTLA
jgi:hypothetical protein